jgi:hypothetical protein
VLTALAITFGLTALLVPLATGIYTYTRTGHRSFLQIPLTIVLVPFALGLPLALWFAWREPGFDWLWLLRLPSLVTAALLIDAIRRLERRLS